MRFQRLLLMRSNVFNKMNMLPIYLLNILIMQVTLIRATCIIKYFLYPNVHSLSRKNKLISGLYKSVIYRFSGYAVKNFSAERLS